MDKITHPVVHLEGVLNPDLDVTGFVEDISLAVKRSISLLKNNLHYVLVAVLLNSVLFLHGLNAVFTATQADLDMPNMNRSLIEPHIDINNNNTHAITFVIIIAFVQYQAFQHCLNISDRQQDNSEHLSKSVDDEYSDD